ncbi:hypothetical protein [Haloterrigena salifodinae]|uniref:hypothetical protein n=1 Tax=Haloterrigena salifodinae TaxID=2675099 RepID=UPI000F86308A|nr:hypothetical protein [Haloterrigena salifodinae]
MADATTETKRFVVSLHRSLLGVLLAVVALIGFGWFRRAAATGEHILLGLSGLAVTAFAIVWLARYSPKVFASGSRFATGVLSARVEFFWSGRTAPKPLSLRPLRGTARA